MGAVSDPLGTHLVKSLNHPGGKVTGVQDRQPIPAQLKLLRTILPKAKRIGVVYTSSDDSSASEYREFRKLAEKEGLTVRPYTITSTNDIEQVAQIMAGKVQAVYVPTTPLLQELPPCLRQLTKQRFLFSQLPIPWLSQVVLPLDV